jgi:hypothetical protein
VNTCGTVLQKITLDKDNEKQKLDCSI